jgi:hypothetical protein
MRAWEFLSENLDLGELIEDDADNQSIEILADTLREIQFSAQHAQIPKISMEALINLVKMKPGGEAFTMEALKQAQQSNDLIKNIIASIKDDDTGVKYVYIKPINDDLDIDSETDADAVRTPPEKTVDSMAKRALNKRD